MPRGWTVGAFITGAALTLFMLTMHWMSSSQHRAEGSLRSINAKVEALATEIREMKERAPHVALPHLDILQKAASLQNAVKVVTKLYYVNMKSNPQRPPTHRSSHSAPLLRQCTNRRQFMEKQLRNMGELVALLLSLT